MDGKPEDEKKTEDGNRVETLVSYGIKIEIGSNLKYVMDETIKGALRQGHCVGGVMKTAFNIDLKEYLLILKKQ